MLASCLKFLRRNALRIGVVLGTFALVASFIFVQQMREAFAEQDYQSARTQVLAAQARAAQLGLDTAEYSDLQRQELTTAAEVPPASQRLSTRSGSLSSRGRPPRKVTSRSSSRHGCRSCWPRPMTRLRHRSGSCP